MIQVKNNGIARWSIFLLVALFTVQCSTVKNQTLVPSYELLSINSSYSEDSIAEATIGPYRERLSQEMNVVIGHSKKRLTETEVESLLGNFVADAILTQSRQHYSGEIHISVINNGGLRAPIPEGPVDISTIYELMPFENVLYILELNGDQTKMLFELLANSKRVAVANSVVLVKDNQPTKIFIDGAPFDENGKYVLAVSDYLAHGGGGMDFLQSAEVLSVLDVKIRDLIIDQIKWLEAQGTLVDAEIEGRVKLVQ